MDGRIKNSIALPKGVHHVRRRGRSYFYLARGRGTTHATPPIRIFGDPFAPVGTAENERFWRELNYAASQTLVFPVGSIKALVDHYRDDDAFKCLSPRTQKVYSLHLDRLAKPGVWGLLPARQLTAPAVKAARDALGETPGMANQMLSVGRTLYTWAIPLGLVKANPFESVRPFTISDRGHVPWPQWIVEGVLSGTPEDLRRMVRLGLMRPAGLAVTGRCRSAMCQRFSERSTSMTATLERGSRYD